MAGLLAFRERGSKQMMWEKIEAAAGKQSLQRFVFQPQHLERKLKTSVRYNGCAIEPVVSKGGL